MLKLDIKGLKREFNDGAGCVRVVALLSPT